MEILWRAEEASPVNANSPQARKEGWQEGSEGRKERIRKQADRFHLLWAINTNKIDRTKLPDEVNLRCLGGN